jgi:transposase InsO family protein
MIRMLVEESVCTGARLHSACTTIGLSLRTLQRWVTLEIDGRHGPNRVPANCLSDAERRKIVAVTTSPEFRDKPPTQIVPLLADQGIYIGSESTLYRVMRDAKLQRLRGRARAPVSHPREHEADGPWQLASWDITYLRSHLRGAFFYLYMVEDVWSRKILGWEVHDVESAELAAQLIERIRKEHPEQDLAGWVLHSDNGGAMKGATMLATLQRLGVVTSFSRPRVSDDNPFIEALFRTLKYWPEYSTSGFASVVTARAWVTRFVQYYNHDHQHSGIGYVAPAERHAGNDVAILAARRTVYARAKHRHPERWSRSSRSWTRPLTVTLNPEVDHTSQDAP